MGHLPLRDLSPLAMVVHALRGRGPGGQTSPGAQGSSYLGRPAPSQQSNGFLGGSNFGSTPSPSSRQVFGA